ncbi:hypothetical protein [Streptosporangium sp. KLBMP 9127]|nr:hypothetical protein [Streptosporangium sp. KLBMP 9127]
MAEFFDVDKSRSIPPLRRPQAALLLGQFANPGRGFAAVVVGEPQRAFYGNQFGLTFPLFEHCDVPLWVPEVGRPIDPANEAHELIMSMFGGISKGERHRIKIRVQSSMDLQVGQGLLAAPEPRPAAEPAQLCGLLVGDGELQRADTVDRHRQIGLGELRQTLDAAGFASSSSNARAGILKNSRHCRPLSLLRLLGKIFR